MTTRNRVSRLLERRAIRRRRRFVLRREQVPARKVAQQSECSVVFTPPRVDAIDVVVEAGVAGGGE